MMLHVGKLHTRLDFFFQDFLAFDFQVSLKKISVYIFLTMIV